MRHETLTVTVPDDIMDWLRAQVESGHFASREDAILAGISNLREESEFEESMRAGEIAQAVAESYDEAHRDPESLLPVEQVISEMEQRHRSRLKKAS